MLNSGALKLVAGAAILALNAAAVSAQAKPTSTKRIPITKEAQGEVAPRVDTVTVTVYKTDTLRLQGRVDTLRMTGATVTVHDTVVQSVPMVARHIGGMYFGLGGGLGLPYGAVRTVNEPGELAQFQVGWQGLNNVFGLRLDGTYNKYARNPDYGAIMGDRPNLMTLNGDVRMDLPFFNATLGSSVRMKPYLLGGGSWVRYNNLRMKPDLDGGVTVTGGVGPRQALIATENGGVTGPNSDWHSDWGFNFGGGIGFHAGKKEVFVESRGIRWNHASSTGTNPKTFHASYNVPIVFGVNFF